MSAGRRAMSSGDEQRRVQAIYRGLGSQLMVACLRHVEGDGLPVYLETPNPKNIAFYERHDFKVTGRCRHGDCPPVTFMLRDAETRLSA
ncbi:MAG: GNAT family N-acetyltransferase [Erythrobacter sp.]